MQQQPADPIRPPIQKYIIYGLVTAVFFIIVQMLWPSSQIRDIVTVAIIALVVGTIAAGVRYALDFGRYRQLARDAQTRQQRPPNAPR